jgi:choline-sulfatase
VKQQRRPPSAPLSRRGSRGWAAAAVTLIVVVALAWVALRRNGGPALRPRACERCNVLLVTIDTLRLDRVGAFGSTRNLTPTLDRLAREGVMLTHAYASAPLTLPSHASILTAVSPPVHGLRANGLFRLGPAIPTLATVLKAAGYRTGAFVGAFVLDARFGLDRGFDAYDDRYGDAADAERRAEDVVRPAAAWIVGGDAVGTRGQSPGSLSPSPPVPQSPPATPWFAWVHLYDPHEPYRAPEPFASQHEPYDAEVAYTDATLGRMLDDLRSAGTLDRTLIVVAADHGESLGEHGERTHGVFVYDVTMRVPVIIWAKPLPNPQSPIPSLTRLIDLAPTLLDLIGVAAPASFEGRSIVGGAGTQSAYVEAMDANLTRNWAPLSGIVTADRKLIDLPIPELYDLRSDPGEATNLFSREAEPARTLQSLLRATMADFASRGSSAEKTTLSADARQRLQALGYVASSANPTARAYTDADDPKNLVSAANQLNAAIGAFDAGRRDEALASVRAIIRAHPQFISPYVELANMQHRAGDIRAAIATLEDLAARGLADQNVLTVLGGYFLEARNPARAREVLEAVVAAHPDAAEAYNSLAVVYMSAGEHTRARATLRRLLALDPTSAKAYENLAADELSARELEPAIADLQRALDLEPRLWDALYNLALAFDATGRRDDARRAAERFVREAPQPRYAREVAEFRALLAR